jgi:thiosulfate reductase cytochrome b subunit
MSQSPQLGIMPPLPRPLLISRHSVIARVNHGVNFLCILVLLMSGLQIYNAHPALYWGETGADPTQALVEVGARGPRSNPAGFVRIGASTFDTTEWLGVSRNAVGQKTVRGFPQWATLPSWRDLVMGRRWHFFFAWLFVGNLTLYFFGAILNGHIKRDLLPTGGELRRLALLHTVADHLRLKLPRGEAARHYNPLQKLSYLSVLFVLPLLMVLTGLTMSPGMDAIFPWLVDLFGGRQSARTIHFLTAGLIVLFLVVHLVMVLLAGPRNELRSMITGKFAISPGGSDDA